MIPQAKARIKAQSKQTKSAEPPFRQHPVHGRVFAPWGVFGAMYAVPTEAEQKKVKKLNDKIGLKLCIIFNVLLVVFAVVGVKLHIDLSYGHLILIFLLPFFYAYAKVVGTKNLTVVQPQLPLRFALRQYALEQDRKTLWFSSLLFSACAGVMWSMADSIHGSLASLLSILAFFFALIATIGSLLIFLYESSRASGRLE